MDAYELQNLPSKESLSGFDQQKLAGILKQCLPVELKSLAEQYVGKAAKRSPRVIFVVQCGVMKIEIQELYANVIK